MEFLRRRQSAPRPAAGIASPVIAEDAYWQQLAQWHHPTLGAEGFAKLLGVSSGSIRQQLLRDGAFPQPLSPGRRNLWSPAQAYEFIDRHRPTRRMVIPRIYHRGDDLAPAAWIAVEQHVLPSAQGSSTTWIVHVWQPADERGLVALAYTDGGISQLDALKSAPQLLKVLDSASAVVVISEEWKPLPGNVSPHRFQAEIVVAERRPGSNDSGGVVIDTYGWFDLANLLRVNLPWWPIGLRRLKELQAWRPGAAPQSVRPRASFFDEDILGRLIAEAADPSEAAQHQSTVDAINIRIEAALYDPPSTPDVPGEVERPGLFQAAYVRNRGANPPPPPTLYELVSLMNLRVPSEAARQRAVELLTNREEVRAVVGTTIRTSERDGPLAQEWISRLRRCDNPESLGASFAQRTFTAEQGQRPQQWWYDPLSDFGWIVQTTDGEYHATVGTQMPARGFLDEFEIERAWTAGFYRASGTVWPLPLGGDGYYTCGYNGTGPDNLIAAVTQLYAAADSVLPRSSNTSSAPAALKELIRTSEAPLFVSETDLARVMSAAQAQA